MTQSMNQFIQAPVLGQVDLLLNGNTISAMVDPAYGGTALVPGQPVKRVATYGGIPVVTPCLLDTDDVYGIIEYDIKQINFPAKARINLTQAMGNVIYMNSAAALLPYAKVKAVAATPGNVATPTTGDTILGRTVDGATAANQLIRVMVILPGITSP